ncbi:toprim domain-containing protein [Macrococcus sp. DPC7161]|uniref:toprim domain-containing protein n=1 Tax=Macrococcus sp. DPC7161 TaxID=2507060 RepID=UPI00100A8129|nr:toprim domain-containing protein [Macrococcus sp. DPC7161]RXK18074.1 topiosmerase [Macrococcus sp. DPC7161]
MSVIQKVIIVEGKNDKLKLKEVLNEPVHIICTHGTMGIAKLDNMYDDLIGSQVFVMTDPDKAGRKIRSWFKRHLSEAAHIYIDSKYGEVGNAPVDYLAKILTKNDFEVLPCFEMKGKNFNYEFNQRFANGFAI